MIKGKVINKDEVFRCTGCERQFRVNEILITNYTNFNLCVGCIIKINKLRKQLARKRLEEGCNYKEYTEDFQN